MRRTVRFLPRRRTKRPNRSSRSFRRVDERQRCSLRPVSRPPRPGVLVRAGAAFLLAFVILATTDLVIESHFVPDPLAQFRTPDGRLTITGRALTPELQQILFNGYDLQQYTTVAFVIPAHTPYL